MNSAVACNKSILLLSTTKHLLSDSWVFFCIQKGVCQINNDDKDLVLSVTGRNFKFNKRHDRFDKLWLRIPPVTAYQILKVEVAKFLLKSRTLKCVFSFTVYLRSKPHSHNY